MPRVRNRDLLPTAVKYRLTEIYDPTDGTYKFRDNDGNAVFTINPETGTVTFASAITFDTAMTFTGQVTFNGLVRGLWPETYYEMIDGTYFTGNASYEDVAVAPNQMVRISVNASEIDTDVFNIYFEIVGSGDTGSPLGVQIYNQTTAAGLAGSDVVTTESTTSQIVRSAALTLTAGTNVYSVKFKKTAGAGFPRIYSARMVIRLKDL